MVVRSQVASCLEAKLEKLTVEKSCLCSLQFRRDAGVVNSSDVML